VSGRGNQKLRTRKALLEAASRLMRAGVKPSLDEVAEAALVSRATAYRYFTNVEALLVEAALDVASPDAATLFADAPPDPIARLERVDDAFDELLRANEAHFRTMLAHSMTRGSDPDAPARQNRRGPLIDAALSTAPMPAAARDRLAQALAVVIGTESMVVFSDVLRLPAEEARAVRRWMIRTLVEASQVPPSR
jgi:AcrR family transcriptional regulator